MAIQRPGEPRDERSATEMVVDAMLGRRPVEPGTPEEARLPVLPGANVTMADSTEPTRLTGQFAKALAKVFEIHHEQERKGSRVPYLGHLLATAGSVLHFGGDENQAIGALLHDAGEDCGGRARVEEIRALFGDDVAAIVEGCSDTLEMPKPSWRERKESYIASLAVKDPRILLVSAADKLDNARAIVADLRQHGLAAFDRFNKESDQPWYYRQLVNAFRKRGIGPIVEELEVAVRELERLAGRAP